MNQSIRDIERAALDFHRHGIGWSEYWARHADAIRKCEPWSRARFRRLIDKLLHLLTCGDADGMEPTDAEPWVQDDSEANKPADVGTQARFDWTKLSGNEVTA